jgi:signal transduction histidine kinase
MSRFSSLRVKLVVVTVVFLTIAPTLGMTFNTDEARDLIWLVLLIGALALALAWFIWSDLFLRQTNTLSRTASKLADGDLAARTGIQNQKGELNDLARAIDAMAESLEKQVANRETAERTLLNRTHQQTAIAALGQFALASTDFDDLLDQTVNYMAQIVEIEYCGIWEMQPDNETLLLRKGTGWKNDSVGKSTLSVENGSLVSHIFTSAGAGAVAITDLRTETRFRVPEFLTEHGVVSGVGVVIPRGTWQFGLLGVFATKERKFSEDELHFLLAVATVIAMAVNRKQTENELQRVANFAQFNPNPVMEFDAAGKLSYYNDAAMSMANVLGKESPQAILPPDVAPLVQECLVTGKTRLRYETRHGTRTVSWSFYPIVTNRVVHCYAGDITEKLNLEAQLRQSQKMESVGQLAAGVAHDFNNMLTIIQGHSGVIMSRPNLLPELLDSAQAIYFASERAANLTRQLLMFSRKNIIQPKHLDLREVVANMSKMLQRMIGEVITLKFTPPTELPSVRGDSGMIEQVVMNLVVNARDAMYRDGGNLTLALKTVDIDRDQLALHPQGHVGHFVCLEVADTGHGMTAETQARIFEPFFTTKEVGKGTGLGLATVYGIVKQHEGWLEVTSEIGKGTTFHVFFPASLREPEHLAEAPTAPSTTPMRGGKETILVVEDEPVLRDLAFMILSECGYRVLQAGSGVEALQVWENECANIDLLLTDMVMPEGMSGKDLAAKLRLTRRDLKVVCVSGYSVDDLNEGSMIFLQKPYTRNALAKTVRDCLDN